MSIYRTVHVSMWGDAKFRSLSDDGKMLWMYLLTSPETTAVPGCIPIGRASLAENLDWEMERLQVAFGELEAKDMARADWRARFIWLPNAIRYTPPDSSKNVIGWMRYIDIIPECDLKDRAVGTLWMHLQARGERAMEPFVSRFGEAHLAACLALLDAPCDAPSDAPFLSAPPTASDAGTGTGTGTGEEAAREARASPPDAVATIRQAGKAGRARAKPKGPSPEAVSVLKRMAELSGCRYESSKTLEARLKSGVPVEDCIAVVEHLAQDPWWIEKRFASADAPFREDKFPAYLAQAKAGPVARIANQRGDPAENARIAAKWEGFV